jgi:hypothetical protein
MIKQNEIKMKLKSSSWPMYMEEICIIQIQRPSRAGGIRTNFHHYILKCSKCPVDLATAVEERNISQLDIKLQERRLNMF